MRRGRFDNAFNIIKYDNSLVRLVNEGEKREDLWEINFLRLWFRMVFPNLYNGGSIVSSLTTGITNAKELSATSMGLLS
jgi:hypothetical protein